MKTTIKIELLSHVIETIQDQYLTDFDDLHFHAFNEDYYIIGYYNAEQWLKKHDISAWEAIETVLQWELDILGEVQTKPDTINPESIANMYIYVLGEELLSDFDLDQDQSDLLDDLKAELKELEG